MLFATEGFESYNAVIRAHSVHSNRHAPSRDIAHALAQSHRVRHLLSGGSFRLSTGLPKSTGSYSASTSSPSLPHHTPTVSPWLENVKPSDGARWVSIGRSPQNLLRYNDFGTKILDLPPGDALTATESELGALPGMSPLIFGSHNSSHIR